MKKTTVLEDKKMRELGFTDHVSHKWYYCTRVGSMTTLNITIHKESGLWDEAVLDEYFGQYAMYGSAREDFKQEVIKNIDEAVSRLNEAGLEVSVNHDDYRTN